MDIARLYKVTMILARAPSYAFYCCIHHCILIPLTGILYRLAQYD